MINEKGLSNPATGKLTLCLDFDGVIHSYTSGWVAPDFIPDPPVKGAFEFIHRALKPFDIVIFSSRSQYPAGIRAMQLWMGYWAERELGNVAPEFKANHVLNRVVTNPVSWPTHKPPAWVTIDDRAVQFTGDWPDLGDLVNFRPWNKE